MGITVKISGLDNALKILDAQAIAKNIDKSLSRFGQNVERQAKQLAPVDEGALRASIFYDTSVSGAVKVGVRADYAAYVEFGTRRFAAAYVATLPATWQGFAGQFKGPGGGTFQQFLKEITDWIHRKGITGTYSVKTRKRTGDKATQASQDKSLAYVIALKILREGIKPQPFLYPAVNMFLPQLIKDLEANIIK